MRLFNQTLIVIIILSLIYGIPEYLARQQARKIYDSIVLNSKMNTEPTSLVKKEKELKATFNSLFAINFFPNDKKNPNGTGGVVMVFLGGFPFGREYCVLNLQNNVISRKRLFFTTYDYDYCKDDVRSIVDCN